MIIAHVIAGIVCAFAAGIAALVAGHSLWTALASYTVAGVIGMPLFAAVTLTLSAICGKVRRNKDIEPH